MPRTTLVHLLGVCSALLATGCQHRSPLDASAPAPTNPALAALGASWQSAAGAVSAIGLYDIALDAETLTTTVTQRQDRQAQDNADVYLLPIDRFLRPDSFRFLSIVRQPTNAFPLFGSVRPRLELTWEFTHPFASSGTIPRADLSFTGIACYLIDVDAAAGHSYFTSDANVILNESLIVWPDGYFQPRTLLNLAGFTANTFPYHTLVDEAAPGPIGGNRWNTATRTRVLNGDNPAGNFGALGWQSGPTETWTGFDVLHQGQSARRTLILDLAQVEAAGRVNFSVAIFDKYSDPKSATPGVTHRLPADPPDLLEHFGYRYPHGCWDVSHVQFVSESRGLVMNKASETELRLKVRDWDARAEASAQSDLALEPDPTKVLSSSVGTPAVRVCVPAALGGTGGFVTFGAPTDDDRLRGRGDLEPDAGWPLDELFYLGILAAPGGVTGPPTRQIWGVVEVADVEADMPPFETVLDANLAPLTTNLPRNVTYQVFSLAVQPRSNIPGFATSGHGVGSSSSTAVAYDYLGNLFVGGSFAGTISLGGSDYTSNGNTDCFVAKYDGSGTFQWAKTWGGTGADEVTCLLISEDAPLSLVIGGSFSNTVEFDPPGGSSRTAAFIDMYVVQRLTSNGSFASVRTFGSPGYDTCLALADNGNRPEADYVLGGWIQGAVNFGGGHTLDTGGSLQGVIVGLDRITNNAKSGYVFTSDDYSATHKVSLFADGMVGAAGSFEGNLLSAAGDVTSNGGTDVFLSRVALNATPGDSTVNFIRGIGRDNNDSVGGLLAFGSGATASLMLALNEGYGSGVNIGYVTHQLLSGSFAYGFEMLLSQEGTLTLTGLTATPGSTPSSGTYYVCGTKSGQLLAYTTSHESPVWLLGLPDSGTGTEAFVWKFSPPAGTDVAFDTAWMREIGGPGPEGAAAVAATADAVALAGYYASSFDIAPGPQTSTLPFIDQYDAFVTQFPSDGSW